MLSRKQAREYYRYPQTQRMSYRQLFRQTEKLGIKAFYEQQKERLRQIDERNALMHIGRSKESKMKSTRTICTGISNELFDTSMRRITYVYRSCMAKRKRHKQ